MSLPAPKLDDRSFQDLVDEAKRYIQERCPEWTDHNVSDPGVTLIEAFAWMTDLLLYRLNRVPERSTSILITRNYSTTTSTPTTCHRTPSPSCYRS